MHTSISYSWYGDLSKLFCEVQDLLLGGEDDALVPRHVVGEFGGNDFDRQREALRCGWVLDSAPHIVHTLLQLGVDGPGVQLDVVGFQLPIVVKYGRVGPAHVGDLYGWGRGNIMATTLLWSILHLHLFCFSDFSPCKEKSGDGVGVRGRGEG